MCAPFPALVDFLDRPFAAFSRRVLCNQVWDCARRKKICYCRCLWRSRPDVKSVHETMKDSCPSWSLNQSNYSLWYPAWWGVIQCCRVCCLIVVDVLDLNVVVRDGSRNLKKGQGADQNLGLSDESRLSTGACSKRVNINNIATATIAVCNANWSEILTWKWRHCKTEV